MEGSHSPLQLGSTDGSAWLERPIQVRARTWLEMTRGARRGATLLRPDGLAKERESLGHGETWGILSAGRKGSDLCPSGTALGTLKRSLRGSSGEHSRRLLQMP